MFSLEDQTVDDDLVELQKRLESSGKVDLILAQVVYDRWKQVPLRCVVCSVVGERCSCCCGRSYCHVGSLSLDGGDCGVTVYPKQAFNVGHVDLLQVKFEDVDMDADTSAYGDTSSNGIFGRFFGLIALCAYKYNVVHRPVAQSLTVCQRFHTY